jgi:peptidoglycan/LPS O-acetylase OafA/YrhL
MLRVEGLDGKRPFAVFGPRETVRQLFVPPRSNLLPIDGLRALSIVWVMLWHVRWYRVAVMPSEPASAILEQAPRLIVAGHYGVDVFFVISGFLIGFMLMREQEARGAIDVGTFYARRFVRLMPAYFFCLAVYCLAGGPNRDMVWANVAYVNNFLPGGRQAMAWAWSLAIEEQFYLVFPAFLVLVFYRIERGRVALLFALLALAVLIRAWVAHQSGIHAPLPMTEAKQDQLLAFTDRLYTKPHTRYGALLCGVIAAALYRRGIAARFFERRPGVAALCLAPALGSIAIVALAPLHVSAPDWRPLASGVFLSMDHYAVAAGVAYLTLYSLCPAGVVGRAVRAFLSARAWYPIAQLSYSAYLLNPIVLEWFYRSAVARSLEAAPAAVFYIVGPALTLLAASPLYVFLEKPFMNLREVHVRTAAGRSAPSAS